MATTAQLESIARHGRDLLGIFPKALERDPVLLCKKLHRLERIGNAIGQRLCNGPQYPQDEADNASADLLAKVNKLLGNVREYQPKTGRACGCKRGQQRDNCSACEGTGQVIDFAAIRNRQPLVPVFVNLDPRGYALKIEDSWIIAQRADSRTAFKAAIHRDWGGYGIICPEITA